MTIPDKHHARRVFGVLLDLMHFGYQEAILSGTIEFCREKDIELRCFVNDSLAPGHDVPHGKNILFDLVDETNVDGLIVITTALQNEVGKNAVLAFLERYHPIPMVSIGEEIPLYPSLIIDNGKGLMDLLVHLADVHGYKRPAFITGPPLNSESQIRFNTYKEFLKARDWPYDPDLVIEGDFKGVSGRKAVTALLDERNTDFDVIIASNDLMAMGAIEELALRGVQVPGQAFVVGFDDMAISKNAALTTVRQPLHQQGYIAAKLLFDLFEKKTPITLTQMPTELVVRESCGCYSPNLAGCDSWTLRTDAPDPGGSDTAAPLETALGKAADFFPAPHPYREWMERMTKALNGAFERAHPEEFIMAWSAVIFEAKALHFNLSSLQELISGLRKTLIACRKEEKRWAFYEDQFHRARVMVEESVRKVESAERTSYAIREEKLNMLGNEMEAATDVDTLFDLLFRELPLLGVRSCYLSLFEPTFENSRLVFAYNEEGRIRLKEGGMIFCSKDLIPIPAFLPPSRRRKNFVVHALVHQEKKLGFILFELGDDVTLAVVLEFLRMKISVTLQYILMFREIVTQAAHLEVFNKELEQSNRALQEFAYVASHDLQEPLRKIVTFGERLAGRIHDTLDDQSMDYLKRMQSAASRMQKLIDSLLSYSRVTTMAKPFAAVDLGRIVGVVLSDLEVRIEKMSARVEVGPLPVIKADPTQMHQLFQNLIQNALKFQKPAAKPLVKMYALPPDPEKNQTIIVEDNGIGIDPRHIDKIFGVFKRLHGREEYEGSGIGLAICKKIMDRHGGSIRVESELGAGTRFIMRFSPEHAEP